MKRCAGSLSEGEGILLELGSMLYTFALCGIKRSVNEMNGSYEAAHSVEMRDFVEDRVE
jgi:hypothetical protein